MSDAPLILGISGLRGIVGESLTPEIAMRYAAAFGTWLNQRDTSGSVVLGRDGRAAGEEIYECVLKALMDSEITVSEAGVAMTPTVAVIVDQLRADAGLIVTASHNPQQWNGLKILIRDINPESDWCDGTNSSAPPPSIAHEIISIYENREHGQVSTPGRSKPMLEPHRVHASRVVRALESLYGDRVSYSPSAVVDSVNCSGSQATAELMEMLGVHSTQLAGDNSGIFPHPPEPTKENLSGEGGLCDAVPALKADIGFAQDPDADRLAIVDENGTYIGEEYTLVFAAESLLQARGQADGGPGASLGSSSSNAKQTRTGGTPVPPHNAETNDTPIICVNLSTSRMIDDVAQRHGARVVRTPVGEAHVVEMMKKLRADGHDVILAGEGNGGVIWPMVTYVRDSLSAMALTLALMARTGKSISELVAAMPSYEIIKRKQPLPNKGDAVATIERIAGEFADDPDAKIDTQDGVRIDWPTRKAWVHVRASNTEPILRLIAEAPARSDAEAILDRINTAGAGD